MGVGSGNGACAESQVIVDNETVALTLRAVVPASTIKRSNGASKNARMVATRVQSIEVILPI